MLQNPWVNFPDYADEFLQFQPRFSSCKSPQLGFTGCTAALFYDEASGCPAETAPLRQNL